MAPAMAVLTMALDKMFRAKMDANGYFMMGLLGTRNTAKMLLRLHVTDASIKDRRDKLMTR
jgi:hypothetical protein